MSGELQHSQMLNSFHGLGEFSANVYKNKNEHLIESPYKAEPIFRSRTGKLKKLSTLRLHSICNKTVDLSGSDDKIWQLVRKLMTSGLPARLDCNYISTVNEGTYAITPDSLWGGYTELASYNYKRARQRSLAPTLMPSILLSVFVQKPITVTS